jgi:hypothetical protein
VDADVENPQSSLQDKTLVLQSIALGDVKAVGHVKTHLAKPILDAGSVR